MKNKGFTLIELLVVVAIIGVLASMVMSNLNEARERARDTSRLAMTKNIEKALEMYYLDNGGYPPCRLAMFYVAGDPCFEDELSNYINLDLEADLGTDHIGIYYHSRSVNNYQTYGMFINLLSGAYSDLESGDGGNWSNFYELGEDPKYCMQTYPSSGNAFSDSDWFHVSDQRCIGGN